MNWQEYELDLKNDMCLERKREWSGTKINDYHFINNFSQLLRIAVDERIAWGLTRKERRENKRRSEFRERERLRCDWRCLVSPLSTNGEQIWEKVYLATSNDVKVMGQDVDQFAFAFLSPLTAQHS